MRSWILIILTGLFKMGHTQEVVTDWPVCPLPDYAIIRAYDSDWQPWILSTEEYTVKAQPQNTLPEKRRPINWEYDADYLHQRKEGVIWHPVKDGYLVALRGGEWGGSLWWYSEDGMVHYKISDHQIKGFFEREGRIFAAEGLAHLDISEGNLLELFPASGKWKARVFLELPEAPCAFGLDPLGNLYLFTSSKLLVVDRANQIRTLLEDGFWKWGLFPASVRVLGSKVWAGMRHGVLRVDIYTREQKWYHKGGCD